MLAMVGAVEWTKLVTDLSFLTALDPLTASTIAPLLRLTHRDLLEDDDPIALLFNEETEVWNGCYQKYRF